jgi:uncharacterized protein
LARILLLLIIVFVIYLLFRGFLRSQVKDAKPQARTAEDMITCARCGVNTPRSEAREEGGKLVCGNNAQCR